MHNAYVSEENIREIEGVKCDRNGRSRCYHYIISVYGQTTASCSKYSTWSPRVTANGGCGMLRCASTEVIQKCSQNLEAECVNLLHGV